MSRLRLMKLCGLIILFIVLLAFQNCQRPKAGSLALNSSFNHAGITNQCSSCHNVGMVAAALPVPGFTHQPIAADCSSCHHSTVSWMDAAAPAGLVYDLGQDLFVTTYTATYSATSITSLTARNAGLHNAMNHNSPNVPSAISSQCAACHVGAPSGQYAPGNMHDSLNAAGLPQPTGNCNDCHSYFTRPAGFVGPFGGTRNPAGPEMKHDAVLWSGSAATSTMAVTQDCSVCHHSPGVAWNDGVYHASLTSAQLSQPASCLDCHANSRPGGMVPTSGVYLTQYNHANGGMNECSSCHNNTTTWAGSGVFHASSGTQTSCIACHSGNRPTNTTGWAGLNAAAPFDYSTHGNNMDCVSCHSTVAKFSAMTDWQGGNFKHTSTLTTCRTCHNTQRPAAGVLYATFDHGTSGTGDCVGCHKQAAFTNNNFADMTGWKGGQAQPSGPVGDVNITINNAIHLNYTPPLTGASVSSTTLINETLPAEMLHSSTQVPASIMNNCVACHAQANSGIYAGGIFHASLTTAGLAQPTSCTDCHAQTLPTDIVGATLTPMDHAAAFKSGMSVTQVYDCAACHANAGGVWSGGIFHTKIGSNVPANCTTCHYPVQPSTSINEMLHTSTQVKNDCTVCHALPTAAQVASPASTNWSPGKYHDSLVSSGLTQPTSCTDCHMTKRPNTITTSNYDTQHMSHGSNQVGVECATCHSGDIALSPRQWSKSDLMHIYVPSPGTCTECHGLGNGSTVPGTNNDLPAGLTNSTTLTTSAYASAGTYDQITHTDVNVGKRDCNICHSNVGISNNGGVKWKMASFHVNTPMLTLNQSTGRCDNCHMNIKPSTVVTYSNGGVQSTFDHGTIGTSDCSTCHNFPGTGTAAKPNWLGASAGSPHTTSFIATYENTCVNCHTTGGSTVAPIGMPTTILANVTNSAGKTNIDFAHNWTENLSGANNMSTVSYTLTVCAACHHGAVSNAESNNGAGWTNNAAWVNTGSFKFAAGTFTTHAVPIAVDETVSPPKVSATAQITTCMPCHFKEGVAQHCPRPNTATVNNFPDCVACHLGVGTSWGNQNSHTTTFPSGCARTN